MLHLVGAGGQHGSVGGVRVTTGPGDVLWVPAGIEQVLERRPGTGVLAFTTVRFRLAATPPALPTVLAGGTAIAPLLSDLRMAWRERRSEQPARLRALLALVFCELWRLTAMRRYGLDPAVQERIRVMVDADPASRPTPAQLAALAGMSQVWFGRLFRRTYGCPPRTWLLRQRIARAAEMMESAASVGAVAAAFGYADLFLFSRQFRQVMGIGPRAWLARHGGG
jgi:AraC-like DNA-binding protein